MLGRLAGLGELSLERVSLRVWCWALVARSSINIPSHGLWRSLVSALDWGSRGREFKSPQPDNIIAGQKGYRKGDAPSLLPECPRIAHNLITEWP